MTKKEILKVSAIISFIAVLSIGVLIYTLLPELSDFRNSIYGSIVSFLAVGGVILYVTLSSSISMPKMGKITVWAYLGLRILLVHLHWGRIEALFLFIYSIINIAVTIYIYKTTKKEYKSIWMFGALSYLSVTVLTLSTELINDDWWLTIVIPAVVVAVVVLIPCLIYGIQQFNSHRDWEKLICVPLLGLMGGFMITFMTISSMNVCLDTSKPVYEEFVIIDKNVRTGARQITTYEIEVQKGDTIFKIGISEEAYYNYEISDSITLSIYRGAFNEPYYIHESRDLK